MSGKSLRIPVYDSEIAVHLFMYIFFIVCYQGIGSNMLVLPYTLKLITGLHLSLMHHISTFNTVFLGFLRAWKFFIFWKQVCFHGVVLVWTTSDIYVVQTDVLFTFRTLKCSRIKSIYSVSHWLILIFLYCT